MNVKVMTISSAARKVGVCNETLRRYEKSGVFKPNRTDTGTRIYTEDDISAIRDYRAKLHKTSGLRG